MILWVTPLYSEALVRERTTPTEQPPLLSEVSANFFADRGVSRGQRNGSLRQYSRVSRPEPLLFLSSSSSVVLYRPPRPVTGIALLYFIIAV
jgi:hypothetical protein